MVEFEQGVEHAGVEIPDEVCLGEGDAGAGGGVARGGRGAVHEWLAGEGARLFHECLEAGIILDAGEVLVDGDGVCLAEAEVDGLLQFVERLGGIFAVCEGAGEVVVPGCVVWHDQDGGAACGLHCGNVAAVDGGHQLGAQLAMARPDVGHGPY